MAHPNDDTRYSPSTRRTQQNPEVTLTRGSYVDQQLSPGLGAHHHQIIHNHPNPSSPHQDPRSYLGQILSYAPRHQLNVLHALGMDRQPADSPLHTFDGASTNGGWREYPPGHDPPAQESAPPYYPPAWAYAPQPTNWMAEPGSDSLYHDMTSMVEYDARRWDGQPFQSTTFPSPASSGYPIHSVTHSPVDGQYYASGILPPTPTCSPNTEVFLTQVTSPRTSSPHCPAFTHFPEDPTRDLTYAAQGSPVSEAANNELLGMQTRVNSLDDEYRSRSPPQGQASTSTHGARIQNDGLAHPVQLSTNLEAHFPDPKLRQLAEDILAQRWCENNEDEPPVRNTDLVSTLKILKRAPKYRFEPFFDDKLRCRVVEVNGVRCDHVAARKDRAVGHARAHFAYKPFSCGGKCGKAGCRERYTCASFRNDHVGRKKNPKRPCSVCERTFTAQNLQRHMKQHNVHATASRLSPSPPVDDRPAPKKRKISIFRPFLCN